MSTIKLGWLTQWPIHYHLPIYRWLSKYPTVDVTVIFCDDITLRGYFEDDMNSVRTWGDIDMLAGYNSIFLKNYSIHNNNREMLTLVNPGIIKEVVFGKYDAIVIGGYIGVTYWLALLACKITGTRAIFRGESTLDNIDRGRVVSFLKKYYLKAFFSLIDLNFYSCSGNKKFLDVYAKNTKQALVHCAVDNSYYAEIDRKLRSSREANREGLNINSGDVVITTVGKLVERKNPMSIVKSVARSSIATPVLLFVGDGPLKDDIQAEADRYGVRVIFTGYQVTSQIAKFYSISDIYFQVSQYDPSPKSLNEALNFGLPAIVTSVIGTAEDLVQQGENGFIVELGDEAGMTAALNALSDTDVRGAMGNHSRELIQAFPIEQAAFQAGEAVRDMFTEHRGM